MKKFFLSVMFPICVYGVTITNGYKRYCGENMHEIVHNGCLTGENIVFEGKSVINGSLDVRDSVFEELVVNGLAVVNNVVVNSNAEINGRLDAVFSTFENSLTINSHNSQIKNCKTKSIAVVEINIENPRLILENVLVYGDIVFEKIAGKVIISGKTVIEGKVINGTIVE